LNDNQIRLEILLDYYKAMRNQTGIPEQEDNEKLREIDEKDYEFNYGYLVKHDLVKGEITPSDDGIEYFTPNGGITGYGMDVVERFIDGCVENTEKVENKIIDKTLSTLDKIMELATIWTANPDLYQKAWELLSSLIS
jgi:hypothetical protein